MGRGRGDGPQIDGLAIVDKPAGWTSHDVVARCRKVFGQRRVGHSGTLDPDATGVLLVGLGRVTRLLRFLSDLEKVYTAEVVLGVATSTLDATGEVTGTWDMTGISLDEVRAATVALTGPILQIPPMVSAVQIDGKRLYDLARQGIEVEREARPVVVYAFSVEDSLLPRQPNGAIFPISVRCSSGTYVRTLAADLGAALGGGAHLRNLRRTGIGPFTVDRAVPLDVLTPADYVSPAEAIGHLPVLHASGEVALAVAHGKVLDAGALFPEGGPDSGGTGGPWAVLGVGGELLAVYEAHRGGTVKPAVVVAEPPATTR